MPASRLDADIIPTHVVGKEGCGRDKGSIVTQCVTVTQPVCQGRAPCIYVGSYSLYVSVPEPGPGCVDV